MSRASGRQAAPDSRATTPTSERRSAISTDWLLGVVAMACAGEVTRAHYGYVRALVAIVVTGLLYALILVSIRRRTKR